MRDLPCFGVSFALRAKEYDKISYFGMGKNENYCDKHSAAFTGWFELNADEIDCPYLIPQEYGTRRAYDVKISGKKNAIRFFTDKKSGVYFAVRPYSDEEIREKKHYYDLKKDGLLHCYLNDRMRGIGSESCGPALDEKYRITSGGEFEFCIEKFDD